MSFIEFSPSVLLVVRFWLFFFKLLHVGKGKGAYS